MVSQERIVYIVDDDDDVRNALVTLIRWEGLLVEAYVSAEDFLNNFKQEKGGCLLVDVRMPTMSGLELQQELARRQIHLPIIVMTGHGDVSMAVNAMKAGAVDFIEKPFKNQELLDRVYFCLSQAAEFDKNQKNQSQTAERLAQLTNREREVMDLLVEGKLNKQVAAELDISIRTVEAHRAKIMEKLQAKSLSDIVRMALQA